MFVIHMLPAERGDGLWIEYGNPRKPHRIVVDGGISGAALRQRLEALSPAERHLDLVIVTHIDLDHIGGVLNLLRSPPQGLQIDDIWFNGYRHLPDDEEDVLGPNQGELLSYWIERQGFNWNVAFSGGAVVVPTHAARLPVYELAGGMKLTILGPTPIRLQKLRRQWTQIIEKEGLEPGDAGRVLAQRDHPEQLDEDGVFGASDVEQWAALPEKEDRSPANGSSIAVLAAFESRCCLLAGDSFPSDLAKALRRIEPNLPIRLDAMKFSHHGGKHNTTRALLEAIQCPQFLISSDGSYYNHPDDESIAKVVMQTESPTLYFNHASRQANAWSHSRRREAFGYRTVLPTPGTAGVAISIAE